MKLSKKLLVLPVIALTAGLFQPVPATATSNSLLTGTSNESIHEDTENAFKILTGEVQFVEENTLGAVTVRVENEENLIDFRINENTVYVTADGIKAIDEIKKGDILTVYYIEPLMNIMIYPPQMPASVIVADMPEGVPTGVYAGKFDNNLVSTDNFMKINKSETIKIIDIHGNPTEAALENKYLVVIYEFMTMSIPGQTTPSTIIVLDIEDIKAEAFSGAEEISDVEFISETPKEPFNLSIYSGEGFIENGYRMLALRPIAEANGMTVTWNGEEKSVEIDSQVKLIIGKDSYTNSNGMMLTLGQAPIIVDGATYVPEAFFTDVLGLN